MAILRTIAALCLFAATAAFPQEDAIVPETDFVSTGVSAFHQAEAKVQELLQSGANLDKCKELGQTTITDIGAAVQAQQGILDSLDDGAGCKNEGQAEVAAAQQAKNEADAAAAAAAEALTAATSASVKLAAMPYSTLAGDSCTWIHSDPAYLQADQHYNTCVTNDEEAKAKATTAADVLEAAIAEAARLKKECECRVQGEHNAAWTAANTDNDANSKAWTQAHNMICVADSTTYENCDVPACPVVTKPTRVSADCPAGDTTAPPTETVPPGAELPPPRGPADEELMPPIGGDTTAPPTMPPMYESGCNAASLTCSIAGVAGDLPGTCQPLAAGGFYCQPTGGDTTAPPTETVPAGAETVPAGAETVPAGAETVPAGAETVPAGAETVPAGAETVPAGAETVPAGAETVPAGAETVPAGAETVPAGADTTAPVE